MDWCSVALAQPANTGKISMMSNPAADLSAGFAQRERAPLDAIFAPRTVAVIGATETQGSVGRTLLWNLLSHPFGGTVFPVNPKRASVLGIKAYPTIASVPEKVDLAVIATPAPSVPDVIGQCADAGVRGAIIISAGFKELGPAGAVLERSGVDARNDSRTLFSIYQHNFG